MTLRLNFACGAARWPGFDNSDINREPGTRYIDLEDRPLPYLTASAEIVMHSHGLLMTKDGSTPSHPDLPALLGEFYRVLEPNGWLRLDDNPYRFFEESEGLNGEGAGFPEEQRIPRVELKQMILAAGFRHLREINPAVSTIPAGEETVAAIIGNHGTHRSFAIEAQK